VIAPETDGSAKRSQSENGVLAGSAAGASVARTTPTDANVA
jgi:hypothetical protein